MSLIDDYNSLVFDKLIMTKLKKYKRNFTAINSAIFKDLFEIYYSDSCFVDNCSPCAKFYINIQKSSKIVKLSESLDNLSQQDMEIWNVEFMEQLSIYIISKISKISFVIVWFNFDTSAEALI